MGKKGAVNRARVDDRMCVCVFFFFRQTGRRGRQSAVQQSRGQEGDEIKRKEMGTRGSEGVRREVAGSEKEDF